jgi:hypothetical protein
VLQDIRAALDAYRDIDHLGWNNPTMQRRIIYHLNLKYMIKKDSFTLSSYRQKEHFERICLFRIFGKEEGEANKRLPVKMKPEHYPRQI